MARKIAIIICILMTGMLICIYPGVRETLQETFEGIAVEKQTADADTANAHSTGRKMLMQLMLIHRILLHLMSPRQIRLVTDSPISRIILR